MNRLKWILKATTICCVLLPLLFTVLAYRDNLVGLIVPPQITEVMSGNGEAIQEVLPDVHNVQDVEPLFNNDFQFNPEDRTFCFSVNLTSPLDTPVTVNALNLTVTDDNGTILGAINLGNPVSLVPGQNSTILVEGTLSEELLTLLQNSGVDLSDPNFSPETLEAVGLDLDSIQLVNVNLDVGGLQVHVDTLDPQELFGAQDSDVAEEQEG